ncbi:helix-turn-helix transcriptional regulator [Arthrobacter sp. MYb227]|uniref:helix-turn-helix transcriptional regulator n=1 Tax=Arthrobacter sp. MYb227 TaxID=1848601 RepID=UPI001C6129C7|nr:helix-turn-helix transcriptional regulator [Arthrobacter sp. MYb227]
MTKRHLVLIEEAQFLDVASAFVLSQLALAKKIKLVLLTVGIGRNEQVVASTELGALLGHVAIAALTPAEVASFSRMILGNPTSDSTNQVITAACSGNPVLVEAFIASSLSQNVLRESQGWYCLTQPYVENDEALHAVVAGIQKRLSESDAEALEILALNGAEDSAVLVRVCATDTARLIGTGLVGHLDETRLCISSPLYSQVLRELVPPGRSKHLWLKLSADREHRGALPNSLLWALSSGASATDDQFYEAIETALNHNDEVGAWKLYQLAKTLNKNLQNAQQGARALLGLGQYQLALREIAEALETEDDPREVLRLRSLAATALWRTGDSGDGIEKLLDDWNNQCKTWGEDPKSRDQTEIQRNSRAITLLRLWIAVAQSEDLETTLEQARSIEIGSPKGSLEGLLAVDAKCLTLLRLGKFVEASDSALENLKNIEEDSDLESYIGFQIMATALRVLFAVGEYAKVRSIVASGMPKNTKVYMQWAGTMHLWSALAAVQEGRWSLARTQLYEARAELTFHDPDKLLELCQALCSFEQQQVSGQTSASPSFSSEKHLRRGWAAGENTDAILLARGYLALAGAQKAQGQLAELIDRASASICRHTELQLSLMLWRSTTNVGERGPALRGLETLCAPPVGRKTPAVLLLTRSGDKTQTEELVVVAEELFNHGETGLGAELLANILGTLTHDGDERQRGVLLRRLAAWIDELGGVPWGSLSGVLSERNLTAREKEIIDLVQQGMSNKEIAKLLTVSQRTVEGHLYRVFAKLGIAGRAELDSLP